jgi:hypothetical protein
VQAAPSSRISLLIVFLLTPVMRTVERIEQPSTRALTTATRLAVLSLFIVTIMHERSGNVNMLAPLRMCDNIASA